MDKRELGRAIRRLTDLAGTIPVDTTPDSRDARGLARVFVRGALTQFARIVGVNAMCAELAELLVMGLATDCGVCLLCLEADAPREPGRTVCVDCEIILDDPDKVADMLGLGDDEDEDEDEE